MNIPRGRTSNGFYRPLFLNWPKTSLKAHIRPECCLREHALEEMIADDVRENQMENP